MAIYILELPQSDFTDLMGSKDTGFMGGVDFQKGKGSTSSKADADRLVSVFGCRIVEVKEDQPEISAAGAEKIGAAPREDGADPRVFVNKADRKHQERLERRLRK